MRKLIRVIITTIITLTAGQISAQQTSTYIVKKGDLLVNIAERYGTTVERLEELNPELKEAFYDGMKLTIPDNALYQPLPAKEPTRPKVQDEPTIYEPQVQDEPTIYEPQVQDEPTIYEPEKQGEQEGEYQRMKVRLVRDENSSNVFGVAFGGRERETDRGNTDEEPDINRMKDPHYIKSFSHVYMGYEALFDHFDKGTYSLNSLMLTKMGWGLQATIGANFGIIDWDYASYSFKAGPAFGFAPMRRVAIVGSVTYCGASMGQGKIGGERLDRRYTWGISVTPRVIVNLGIIKPSIGVDFNWNHDTKKIETLASLWIGIF